MQLQFKEVILDDTDVPKALVDFIANRIIDKLILGQSSRNALIRYLFSNVKHSITLLLYFLFDVIAKIF